ncbi:MAG: hypothetical protein IPL23_30285 [Saprospiraceae bacterium]|nr:hypothetical protein [Saprospiraceae bacterium]
MIKHLEFIADDVSQKVGEMERFMEMSSDFMNSIDLQNGVFEDQGLKMLEEYEKKSTLLLMGKEGMGDNEMMDLKMPEMEKRKIDGEGKSDYDGLFS